MTRSILSPLRFLRALKMGTIAAASLYLLIAFVAEPLHSLAATTADTVQVIVANGLTFTCSFNNGTSYSATGGTLYLPNITFTGDTGTYTSAKQVTCKVITNQKTGWTLAWQILSGSGGRGTGRLISQFNDNLPAIGTGSFNNTFPFPSTASLSGWGGRVSNTSSGVQTGSMDFGTDTTSEKYARVATGSTVNVRTSTAQSQAAGDLVRVHFRAYVGSTAVQPTGNYKSTVTLTATANP